MTGRELVVLVALFTVMLAMVAVGIAVTIHRRRRAQAEEARRLKNAPLPASGERLRRG
jgi:hypothetical protein